MITSQELREARHRADLTQAELAARLGVSLRTVTNWETASDNLPERAEQKIMTALGGTISRMRAGSVHQDAIDIPEDVRARYSAVQQEMSEYAVRNVEDPMREKSMSERGVGGDQRKRRLLSVFTDIDLLHELTNRARQRGIAPSSWTARSFEGDALRLEVIRTIADDLNNLTGNVATPEDTQDDFGLVARPRATDRGEDLG